MSIGKNLMVLFSILVFGFVCFVSGALRVKNPETINWAVPMMIGLVILVPNIFEIVNGIGVYGDWPKSEDEKKDKGEKKGKK
jgi:hypothetical protein